MFNAFTHLNPVLQALIAGTFTWSITAIGAACVFATKTVSQKVLDAMLGFAAGVMIAASFWSLLAPAIAMSQGQRLASWIPAASGFLLGTIFLRLIDKVLPHLHIGAPIEEAEGVKTSWNKSLLLVAAITLHNIPEGFAVSVSLRREKISRFKSFWYGQLSAIVEPIAAVVGVIAVLWARPLLPYALGFAAGAMIFVVIEEVIPESQRNGHTDLATAGTIIGFLAMMILDVALS